MVRAIFCLLVAIATPIVIGGIATSYGAEKWNCEDQPVPIAGHVIDVLFLVDVVFTVWLLVIVCGKWRVGLALVTIPLLCMTGIIAFWGGLWVSGQWL